jgi:transposase
MKKTSIETYYELFYRWQRSGLSKSAFADSEGISKVSFYSWCKKFETKSDSQDASTGFTRIELAESASQVAVAKISYPSGVSVELFGPLDPDWIKALVF